MKTLCRLIAFVLAMYIIPVAAQKKSAGWTSLFDGKTLAGWKQATGNAKYTVSNGTIVGTTVAGSPNSFLVTEKEYGDFILELDIKTEDTTINSGVQLRSHFDADGNNGKGKVYGYQCEVDPSSRAWSGGIYDEARRDWLYPLSLHPQARKAFKVNDYNHYRIECIDNNIRTWVNGQSVAYVVDNVDSKGFIGLQVHAVAKDAVAGKKVYFKNIRIQTSALKPAAFAKNIYVLNNDLNKLSDYEKNDGWKLLFDGKTTNGWKGAYKPAFPEKGWKVEDGTITVLSSQGKESANGGDIVTVDQYSAFDLSFEFKLTPGANSGVKYFVTLSENNTGSAIGLEYQVLDDERHPDAKLGRDGNRTLSSLYDMITAKKDPRFVHKIGQWNVGRIIVYPNNHVEHYLNGVKVLEYERGSKDFRDLVAISKYKVWKNFGEAPEGHILLQDHGDEVSFRNIKIKTLK